MAWIGSDGITSQQRVCPLSLPGKQLLIQPVFWFSHILIPPLHFLSLALVLPPSRIVEDLSWLFHSHLPESQLGVGSGDEQSGVEAQFASYCVFSLWTSCLKLPALSFLPYKMGMHLRVSWILNSITCLSCLMCSRYSVAVVTTIIGLCWVGEERWKWFLNLETFTTLWPYV